MNADLSIAPRTALDLAASARPAPTAAARTGTVARTGEAQVERALGALSAGKVEQPETGRLKALLTDPAMRVGTHHDGSSGRVVLRVHDRATGELVDQIPAEELLRLYAALRETLVDERA